MRETIGLMLATAAVSSLLTYSLTRETPKAEPQPFMVLNAPEAEAKAKAEREAYVRAICLKDPLACKIMSVEWKGRR